MVDPPPPRTGVLPRAADRPADPAADQADVRPPRQIGLVAARRRRFVGAAVIVAAGCAVAAAVSSARAGAASGPATPETAAAPCVRAEQTVPDEPALVALGGRLLAARDAVVRSAAGADPGDATLLDGSAAQVVDRLRGLPVTSWTSRVAGLGVSRPPDVVTLRVQLRYRLAGDSLDTVRERLVSAAPRDGCWRLVADEPAPASVPDLWDLGPVRAVSGSRVAVLAAAGVGDDELRILTREAEAAAAAVDRVWGTGWRRTNVVLVPASTQDAARVAGADVRGWDQMSAFAFGPSAAAGGSGSVFGDDRLVVLPRSLTSLGATGLRFVLAHELTHVATAAGRRHDVPTWFAECFADSVAYGAVGYTPDRVRAAVGADLGPAAGPTAPRALPAAADFDPARGDVSAAYGAADVACLALAGPGGTARLADAYRDARSTSWPAVLAAAGTDERRLVVRWRQLLGTFASTDAAGARSSRAVRPEPAEPTDQGSR